MVAQSNSSISFGSVEIRRSDSRDQTEGAGHVQEYVWRPSAALASELPLGLQLVLASGSFPESDSRIFEPANIAGFIVPAAQSGLAILSSRRELSDEERFGYRVMHLVYQWSTRLREAHERVFQREQDLYLPSPTDDDDRAFGILSPHLGLNSQGTGPRWSVSALIEQGHELAAMPGISPSFAECIHWGLVAAAIKNPVEQSEVDQSAGAARVQMALFDLGPATKDDAEANEPLVVERLLAALERHIADPTEKFELWFFDNISDIVYQVAKQKKNGGPVPRDIVRQVTLGLAFRAHSYVGPCVTIQMQAFRKLIPGQMTPEEETRFRLVYDMQGCLGGLPLVMLLSRFAFLQSKIWDIMKMCGEEKFLGVVLRMLEFYGDMASRRREVDRTYKNLAKFRNGDGRLAISVSLFEEDDESDSE